jgi:diaminopimelate decarboxylase
MSLFALDDDRCVALAEEHGTPCFVYDAATARRSYQSLREAIPAGVRLAYAVKANPFAPLLRCLAELGASFDCASSGELERVGALGLEAGRIFFAGPGKREPELDLALRLQARVQAEGWEDLVRLDALTSSELAVNLRVHPMAGVAEQRSIIGGVGPSAFGVDEEVLGEILERARSLERVRIAGLHVFAASNERDAQKLLTTYAMVFDLARRSGIDARQIDCGGGLGVPYDEVEAPLDLSALGRGLQELLRENDWFDGELILEPGRHLAAPCGVYLARVVRTKESRGTHFAILEGGINHLLRPHLTGQNFPVKAIRRDGPTRLTTLAGPLCTSLDRLGVMELPELRPGDLLAFGMTGAYGYTEAMTHFLSHPSPSEIWAD